MLSLASNWMSMSDLVFIRVQGFYNVFQKVTYLKTFLSYTKIIYKIIKYCLLRSFVRAIVKQETKHEDCAHCTQNLHMLFVLKIIK
jgi:hypothetical protein